MPPDALATSKKTRARWFFLGGALLITGLGWYFGFGKLTQLVQGAEPLSLLTMCFLILAGFWVRALKWHYALGSNAQGILLFFIAKTAGNWTPGRAGELAPLLLKRHRNTRVAAWIGLDRVIEVAWTLALGLAGAHSLGLVTTPLWIAGGLAVALLAVIVVVVSMRGCGSGRRSAPEPDSGWRSRLASALQHLQVELKLFMGKMPLIMALTLLAKLTDVYAVVLLCEAFGYHAGLLLVFAARCAHGLVSAIPVTPDATGVPYVAAAWLLHEYAAIPFDTLTAALALEVIVINAILWACFCLASAGRWNTPSTG